MLDANPSALMQQRNFREDRYRQLDDHEDLSDVVPAGTSESEDLIPAGDA